MTIPLPGADFNIALTPVVLGVINGLIYALLGMGLTLVYRTSRVLNFAHGEMGALPALLIPILVLNRHWNYWVTLFLALGLATVVGALVEFLVIRRLQSAGRLTALVATIAVGQVLFITGILIPKGTSNLTGQTYPTPFTATVKVAGVVLDSGYLLILIVAPLVMVALTLFLRRSNLGRASRAAAENVEAARLAGVPAHRVALAMWSIAGLLAGLSAILVGPTRPIVLSTALGPSLLLRALGAAMLGGLNRLPSVFAGGVAIGVIESLFQWNYSTDGATDLTIFLIILVSLLFKRQLGQQARGTDASSWTLASSLRPLNPVLAKHPRVRAARWIGMALLIAVAIVLPVPMNVSHRLFLGTIVLFALMGLSLVVLTGYAGQVSLGQIAFVGVGAAVGGRLGQLGAAPFAALVGAVAVGALLALLIGLPALRIRGLFLAVTTLGFSVAVASWLFYQGWLAHTSGATTSMSIARPRIGPISLEDEERYYWACLAVFVVMAYLVVRLRRSRLGRAMIAVRDNEPSAASLTVSPGRTKLMAFVISGAIASLAGYLYGGLLVDFSYDPSTTFGAQGSLDLVVMTVLGGITTVTGAVVGAAWVQGIPHFFGQNFGVLSSGFGLIAILLLLPGGLAQLLFTVRDRAAEWLAGQSGGEPVVEQPRAAVRAGPMLPPARASSDSEQIEVLRAEGVCVQYGGLVALDDVSVTVRKGEIVGLMGTNGAGKTTLFDVLSGRLRRSRGTVLLHGSDVTGLPPHQRARRGLGRTFQQARLFDDLTVREALHIAVERSGKSARARETTVSDTLDLIGLGLYAGRYAGELSTGTRRLAELGCVTALGASVLLLDEPTAGFTTPEIEDFVAILRQLRDEFNMTLLVIDHDVPMMLRLTERLYVLEAGRVIAEGAPELLRDDPRVKATYLGTALV